jgi:hypothetical protein
MSTVKSCLCALHTDIAQNGSNLDVQAAQQRIFQINQYFKSDITFIESGDLLKYLQYKLYWKNTIIIFQQYSF